MNVQNRLSAVAGFLARTRLTGVAILGVAMLLATLIVATGPEAEPQERAEKAWPVSVIEAHPGTLSPTLVAFGKVESRQVANLTTSIGARINDVVAREGQWVDANELLVVLDRSELELALRRNESEFKRRVAQLTAVRNEFASAERMTPHHESLKQIADAKLKRHEDLYERRMISDAILDEVRQQASERALVLEQHNVRLANFPSLIEQHEASVAEARAQRDQASLDLAQTEIRAPFPGRVVATMVSPGDRVRPGVPLVQVADFEGLEVRASVPARYGQQLRDALADGRQILAVGEVEGATISLTLARLSADVKTGQSGLDAFFLPLDSTRIDLGRVVSLQVTMPPEPGVVPVPVQAIYENERVYRVVDSRLEGLTIEHAGDYVSADGEHRVLVRAEGMHDGDRIVITQLPRAITGLLVAPVDAAAFDEALVTSG